MVEKRTFRPLSKATWGIYLFFVAARVFFAFQPGYIHPDEYFQNAEITAGNIFGLTVNTPWEYLPERPCRSILMPTITTGIPLTILKIILGSNKDHYVPSSLLFNAQRASFLFLSLVLDALIVRIARQIRRSPSIALLLISSSYVTLSYHTHPFSNSVEAVVLTMCIAVLSSIVSDVESTANTAGIRMRTFLLGVLFALGTFTRITFVLYGFPLGVTFLIVVGKAALAQSSLRSSPQSSSHSSPPSTPQPSMPKAALRFIASCIPLALGISLGVAVNVIMDSLYFGKLTIVQSSTQETITHWIDMLNPRTWRDLEFQGSLTVTFLNNLLYNLDENNLAEHGLHPRYLHLLVNFPVLYANLAYVGIRTIGEKVIAQRHYTSHSTLVTALAYSGISGVLLLSVMPHQEARFLTPLLIPLVLTLASRVSKLGRTFWPLWLVYNLILAVVFCIFHQAGITPAIATLQKQALGIRGCQIYPPLYPHHAVCDTRNSTTGVYNLHREGRETFVTHAIFYKTYMPPYHLFGLNEQEAGAHRLRLQISDWRSLSHDDLIQALSETPGVKDANLRWRIEHAFAEDPGKAVFIETSPGIYWRNVLIAPSTVDLSSQPFYKTHLSFKPHANLDHMDVIVQKPFSSFSLNVYYI